MRGARVKKGLGFRVFGMLLKCNNALLKDIDVPVLGFVAGNS